jgi:uncharacterized protein (TIGR00297 family)
MAVSLALCIAGAAWRAGSLSASGALAAFATGGLALAVQWSWGAYLIGWFILASALSHLGRDRKAARTHAIVSKGGQRDAVQVLANGGVFAACALYWLLLRSSTPSLTDPWPTDPSTPLVLAAASAGALAAAGADTWSTEIGTLVGGKPWSLRTGGRVSTGTSGAVTLAGTLGGLVGALVLALLAHAVGMIPRDLVVAVASGGIAGATADTLLGAWLQERRWCDVCGAATERAIHDCGASTIHQGGLRRLQRLVNVACAVIGGAVAAGLS